MAEDVALRRPASFLMDQRIGEQIPVLDHGFIRLIDYMGNDAAVVQAARVSYGDGTKSYREDEGLIRYLMRNQHTSPFEQCELKLHCKMPIFVARQWIRHRTACLAGSVRLDFDLPRDVRAGTKRVYGLTVKQVYDKFQPTITQHYPSQIAAQERRAGHPRNPFRKRDRVRAMHLRCVDESTNAVQYTHIVDVWESGVKPVYQVTLANGCTATMSANHLCLTSRGWLRLKDFVDLEATVCLGDVQVLSISDGVDVGVTPVVVSVPVEDEGWHAVAGWEGWYDVSTHGRVRRVGRAKGAVTGRVKQPTPFNKQGHLVVSLNRPGHAQSTRMVHDLVLEAFVGPAPRGYVCRHLDSNGCNNQLSNLRWGTPQDNADDRVGVDSTTRLRAALTDVRSVVLVGDEMTYDLEVEGPWHNFAAGGVVLHNSVNEYSMRYSEAKDEFYLPDREHLAVQSKTNHQGRAIDSLDPQQADKVLALLYADSVQGYDHYQWMLSEANLARELARMDLTLNYYTEWYWKIDLHNLLHFLKLRTDAHAQYEIRVYAQAIDALVSQWVPVCYRAYVDYMRDAVTFSRPEMQVLRAVFATAAFAVPTGDNAVLSAAELREFMAKLKAEAA